MSAAEKSVAVITPVYNGELFLQDCIRSVLGQTHENFDYFIADNCSTDRSLEIARDAAESDSRIKVISANEHVGPIQNWNRSLTNVNSSHDFIKFVHADDWIFPQCISRLLAVAEANPGVGIVSSYRLEEDRVSLDRLPSDAPLVPGMDTLTMDGRAVVRAVLLERASVLGSPTSTLLRTTLVHEPGQYFSTKYLHADKEACLRSLMKCDFGFVRQVLSFTRRHNESVTSLTNTLDTRRQENLLFLMKYGKKLLTPSEYQRAWDRELQDYYQFLAGNVGTGKSRAFWDSHKDNLAKAGADFSQARLLRAFFRRWTNPGIALRALLARASSSKAADDEKTHGFLDQSRDSKKTEEDR